MKAKAWKARRDGRIPNPQPGPSTPARASERAPASAPVHARPHGPGYVHDPYLPGPSCEVVKADPKGDPYERFLAGVPEIRVDEILHIDDSHRKDVQTAFRSVPRVPR